MESRRKKAAFKTRKRLLYTFHVSDAKTVTIKICEQGTKIYTKMVSVSLDEHIKNFSIIWWAFLDQLLDGLESAIVCRFPVSLNLEAKSRYGSKGDSGIGRQGTRS